MGKLFADAKKMSTTRTAAESKRSGTQRARRQGQQRASRHLPLGTRKTSEPGNRYRDREDKLFGQLPAGVDGNVCRSSETLAGGAVPGDLVPVLIHRGHDGVPAAGADRECDPPLVGERDDRPRSETKVCRSSGGTHAFPSPAASVIRKSSVSCPDRPLSVTTAVPGAGRFAGWRSRVCRAWSRSPCSSAAGRPRNGAPRSARHAAPRGAGPGLRRPLTPPTWANPASWLYAAAGSAMPLESQPSHARRRTRWSLHPDRTRTGRTWSG